MNSLRSTANYLYIPKNKPSLEVDPLGKKPDNCLYSLLPSFPLPREVYFLGVAKGNKQQDVYAMSLDTEADQFEDIKTRTRFEIKLQFPLAQKLKNEQELDLWFTALTFKLFKKEGLIKASIVTEDLGKHCFEADPLFNDKKNAKIPPAFWP